MEKLVLIDGNSLINRAFYAMPLLLTKDGTPTNAVYGFMNMFFKMLAEIKPTYVAVAFDVHAPTFRHKMYAEYKGTRKPMPEELRPQIPLLKEVLSLMGVCVLEKAGLEADDIIGTVAKSTAVDTIIYTGDKDSFQLVDKETSVYFTRRGITEIDIYNFKNFTEKTGINPIQIIDLKALMGDASDNIPGVAGIGEKTALNLVKEYQSVDNLYDNVNALQGKLKEKIQAGKDSCYLSKTLATINVNSDIDFSLENMVIPEKFEDKVRQKFIELEFKSLFSRQDLFYSTDVNTHDTIVEQAEIKVVNGDIEGLKEFIFKNSQFAFSYSNRGVCLYADGCEYDIKLRENLLDEGFGEFEVFNALKDLFESENKLIVFDKKTLKHYLENFNIQLKAPCDDLAIIKYLTDFSGGEESETEAIANLGLSNLPRAYAVYSGYEKLYKVLIEEKTLELYKNVELPLSDVLFDMENSGFKVDEKALIETGKKYAEILSGLESEIRNMAGVSDLNVNSPKQLGEVLFEKLKIGKGKKTKTGYSTNAEVLEQFEDNPIIPPILRYRQIQKLQSTYIEGFKPLIEKNTGLIHTSFNQTVTATGRLSSKEPNLQNIPVREEEGRELRKFFVPKTEERVLVSADYSQIELRLLAAFSGCERLIKAFDDGIDVHAETASRVFNVRLDKVTKDMRRSAKAVNFGIIYGISEYGLAKNIKVSPAQAKEYIESYFREYPEVKKYMTDNVEFAKANGYAVTMLGRRRYIRELKSSNYMTRQFGERVAMNMPLQGSAADVIKIAMINVANRLKREGLKTQLILQIHDELILDAFISEVEQAQKILIEEMEGAVKLRVKLTVEAGRGKTWFEAK